MLQGQKYSENLLRYQTEVTGIKRYIKGTVDRRTEGVPTRRTDYRGVCRVQYYGISIRRYLDALAHALVARALGEQA
jgi:hypothetical protein